jgi:hypothetical protein
MKHVTFAEKSVLLDDETADLLLEYARVLGSRGSNDTVTVRALGPDGNTVDATLLLNPSTTLMTETATAELTGPENGEAIRYIRDRIDEMTRPHNADGNPADDTEFEDLSYEYPE